MQNRTHDLTSFTAFSRLSCNPRVNDKTGMPFLGSETEQTSAIRSVIYRSVAHSTGHHRLLKFAPVVILIHEMNISNRSIFAVLGAHQTMLLIYLLNK